MNELLDDIKVGKCLWFPRYTSPFRVYISWMRPTRGFRVRKANNWPRRLFRGWLNTPWFDVCLEFGKPNAS